MLGLGGIVEGGGSLGRREKGAWEVGGGRRRLIKDLNTEPTLWADYCQKRKQILKEISKMLKAANQQQCQAGQPNEK